MKSPTTQDKLNSNSVPQCVNERNTREPKKCSESSCQAVNDNITNTKLLNSRECTEPNIIVDLKRSHDVAIKQGRYIDFLEKLPYKRIKYKMINCNFTFHKQLYLIYILWLKVSNNGVHRSKSSPHITLKQDQGKSKPQHSSKRPSVKCSKEPKLHTYHEIYIDLQNSIMMEHETNDPSNGWSSQLFIGQDGLKHRKYDVETLEMGILNEEIQSKVPQIVSNSILDSYAELKAWTTATNTSVCETKVNYIRISILIQI